MKNIKEMKAELENGMNAISVDFANDYEGCSSYICDAISEHADSNTSIYHNDITAFMENNIEAVNDAINEFGWEGCGSDLYKAGQMAEYLQNEQVLYDDLDSIKLHCALQFLEHLGHTEINAELWETIEDALGDIDNNDRMEDISETLVDTWETWKEEAEAELLPGVA